MTGSVSGQVVGVDVGGTFTDLILLETTTGKVQLAKVPSTTDNQAYGVLAALEEVDANLSTVDLIVHGTTTTTNAVLERKLSRTGLITTAGFRGFLVFVGFVGSHDPLANILPLFILTLWWVGFIILQAVVGDIWRFLNPWTGLYRILKIQPVFSLPERLGSWLGILGYLVLGAYSLVYIAPDNPEKLAIFISGYSLYTLSGMILFGEAAWLARAECLTMLLRNYALLSCFKHDGETWRIGMPGWQLLQAPAPSVSGSIFVIIILATGTFDGLNETFWWLGQIGINPLAFPGRSAVITPTLIGLIGANILLPVLFAITVKSGLRLAGEELRFTEAFGRLSRAILPIALAYHYAHYLPTFLVNAQYSLAATSNLWATGADYLGLGVFYVTTGFFNNHDSVKIIWLSEACVVVAGHILAILIAHAIAIDLLKDGRKAILSQIPPAFFMILYTLFGLWLLASPRGI